MSISNIAKKITASYMLIAILFFGYNMLQLPKLPYFAIRLLIMLIVSVYAISVIKHSFNKKKGVRIFVYYIIYQVFTFIFIFFYNYPVSLIPDAVMSGLFPMLFFFVGSADKEDSLFGNDFYKYYFWGCIFMFVCSIYLFLTMPSWYLEWKSTMVIEEYENNLNILGSMSGFSGSGYLVGYTALFSFCYLIFKFKTKDANKLDIFLMFIVVFCLFFSQVRVAMLMAIVILLWYLLTTLNIKSIVVLLLVVVPVTVVLIRVISNSELLLDLSNIVTSKIEVASNDKRYETGIELLSQQTNYLFGHGYGSGGHKARSLGLLGVTDFEIVKVFYETGIIGFIFFFAIAFKALLKKPRFCFEFFIVAFYMLAMLIANPLTADATMSPIFWYAVGRRIT